jgi:hypothetical protein
MRMSVFLRRIAIPPSPSASRIRDEGSGTGTLAAVPIGDTGPLARRLEEEGPVWVSRVCPM